MTPMIDVVFLLIIFFLVSSHLAKQESRLPLDLPTAKTSTDTSVQRQALTVNIDDAENVYVFGASVDKARLRSVLDDHVMRKGDAAAIRIRTHRDARYETVEPVLGLAAAAGITDVSLSVQAAASASNR